MDRWKREATRSAKRASYPPAARRAVAVPNQPVRRVGVAGGVFATQWAAHRILLGARYFVGNVGGAGLDVRGWVVERRGRVVARRTGPIRRAIADATITVGEPTNEVLALLTVDG